MTISILEGAVSVVSTAVMMAVVDSGCVNEKNSHHAVGVIRGELKLSVDNGSIFDEDAIDVIANRCIDRFAD